MQKLLLIAERQDELFDWIFLMLHKDFIAKKFHLHSEVFKPPFFLNRLFSVIIYWLRETRKFKPDKIFIYGKALTSVWLFVALAKIFSKKTEVIVFRYDIEHFRPYGAGIKSKIGHFVTRQTERFCILRADKIVHKGVYNELEFLPYYNKIKEIPHYLFREFINKKNMLPHNIKKLSDEDGEIHIVNAGQIPLESTKNTDSIWELYPKITSQKMHFHVYMKIDDETTKKFRKIEKSEPYFHYEGYLTKDNLVEELAKYDYGAYLATKNIPDSKKKHFTMTAVGYRVFDYISAYLPILCCNEAMAIAKIVEINNAGYSLDYDKISLFSEIITKNKKQYPVIVRNLKKLKMKFSDYTKFVEFIKK